MNTGAALCTRLWGIFSSALLVESLPPAMTTSASPRSMSAAAEVTEYKLEVQARVTVAASTVGGRPASMTISRPMLTEAEGSTTPPQTRLSTSLQAMG